MDMQVVHDECMALAEEQMTQAESEQEQKMFQVVKVSLGASRALRLMAQALRKGMSPAKVLPA